MESSGAVFTRQNPFSPTPPIEKTHYHISRGKKLSTKKRKTVQTHLSPVTVGPKQPAGRPTALQKTIPPASKATTVDETRFSEAWPSTDLESSPKSITSTSNIETTKQSAPAIHSVRQQDLVLAKYIDRFRHGQPQSREKHKKMTSAMGEDQVPFWWMSPTHVPSSSTPTRSNAKDATLHLKEDASNVLSPASQCGELLDVSALVLSDTSQGELNDCEILQLQERAHRLLQKSECSVSSDSIPISSEGIGCSDFSPPVTVDEPVRRPSVPTLLESTSDAVNPIPLYGGPSRKPTVTSSLVPHTRPDEDILFQWRLRRKMEQARQWPQSHSQPFSSLHQGRQPLEEAQKAPPSSFMTSTKTEREDQLNPCQRAMSALASSPPLTSGPMVAIPQTDGAVPAHMHLLCDILPCPRQPSSSTARGTREMNTSHARNRRSPGNSVDAFAETPVSCPDTPPASLASPVEQWPAHRGEAERTSKETVQPKKSDKTDRGTGMSNRRQKRITRHQMEGHPADIHSPSNRSSSRHRAHGQKLTSCAEQPSEREQQQMSCRSEHSGNYAPPPSPIHSALGQVVSEALFPTLDTQCASVSPSGSFQYAPAASSRPVVPLSNAQQPLEIISQLWQDAEDSDENEFANDPLLQVLRKQRKWVKEQLSEVDSVLGEFHEE